MIEHDLTNVPDLNNCVKPEGCNGFDGLSHDGPTFERWGCVNDIMIIFLVSVESVSVLDQEITRLPDYHYLRNEAKSVRHNLVGSEYEFRSTILGTDRVRYIAPSITNSREIFLFYALILITAIIRKVWWIERTWCFGTLKISCWPNLASS